MEYTRVSPTFLVIRKHIEEGDVKISAHGYDELSEHELYAQDLIEGFNAAVLIEDYPLYPKGACVLVLQADGHGKPVHVVWGVPKGHLGPAVLVTAYRPDDDRWDAGFTRRKR